MTEDYLKCATSRAEENRITTSQSARVRLAPHLFLALVLAALVAVNSWNVFGGRVGNVFNALLNVMLQITPGYVLNQRQRGQGLKSDPCPLLNRLLT